MFVVLGDQCTVTDFQRSLLVTYLMLRGTRPPLVFFAVSKGSRTWGLHAVLSYQWSWASGESLSSSSTRHVPKFSFDGGVRSPGG